MRKQEWINMALMAMLGQEDLVCQWWDSPNRAMDMKTPKEVWDSGIEGQDQVFRYVADHTQQ